MARRSNTTSNGGTTAFSTAQDTASITTTDVNDAPTLDNSGSPVFTSIDEDNTGSAGDLISTIVGASINDVDLGAVEGIAITATDNSNGAWQYSTDNGASWSAVGVVSEGSALLLHSSDRLRFVPDTLNADTATVTYRAWDRTSGVQASKVDTTSNGGITAFSTAQDTATITVTAVNDAPVLDNSGTPTLTTINEDAVTNSGNLVSTILGVSVTDIDLGASGGIAVTSLDNSRGAWQFSTNGGTTWSAVGSVSESSALLLRSIDRLRFVPDAENADAATVTYRAWDQTSGSTGTKVDTTSNGGTTAFSTAQDTASITVTDVNDAPVLDNSGTPTLTTIDEDATTNNGDLVSAVIGSTITDVDTASLSGIAVTGVNNSQGLWQYSTDNGASWQDVGAVSDSSALLLWTTDRLRFVPDALNADTATISYRGWDQTSGVHEGRVDVTGNGGATAYSAATETAGITVTAVNDAPMLDPLGTPTLTSITEDATSNGGDQVGSFAGAWLSDVDNGSSSGIAVTALDTSRGTWQYSTDNGATWSAVGVVSDGSALLLRSVDRLRFVPDTITADTASVTYRAWDQTSGSYGTKVDTTSNGGTTAFSTDQDTASITVTDVNDAPVLDNSGTPTLANIDEDATANAGELISSIVGTTISDIDTGPVEGVAVTALDSGNGAWEYSTDGGTTWLSVGSVSESSALLLRSSDRLRFVPDTMNADTATVTYRAWDQTSGSYGTKVNTTSNGGAAAFSTAQDTAGITTTTVNDAPTLDNSGSPALTSIDEDNTGSAGDLISTIVGASIDDVDQGAVEGIAITGTDNSNGRWQYSTDNGATWSAVGVVSESSALLLRDTDRLRFVPDTLYADTATVTYRAWDQTSGSYGTKADTTSNGGTTAFSTDQDTASITVTDVNDAPVIDADADDSSGSGGADFATVFYESAGASKSWTRTLSFWTWTIQLLVQRPSRWRLFWMVEPKAWWWIRLEHRSYPATILRQVS